MMIHIEDLRLAPGIGGFWVQDQPAIQTGAPRDGFFYEGEPVSAGFRRIKEPSEAYCVMLRLRDGARVYGDCLTVVDAGYAGRPVPLRHEDMPRVEAVLRECYLGKTYGSFHEAAKRLDEIELPGDTARPVSYGVSQALLAAAGHASGLTMAEVIADEFGTKVSRKRLEFAVVCEGDPYTNVDKAIVRRVAMFPHCGMQRMEDLERLREYVVWMVKRLERYGAPDYQPDMHVDFHSMLGRVLGNDIDKICSVLGEISDLARPYQVYFEDPMLAESARQAQENMQAVRRHIDSRGLSCRLIADEWANSPGQIAQFARTRGAHAIQIKMPDNGNLLNSIQAVRACTENGVLPYLGGTVNDTDIAARTAVHLGMALNVWRVLSRPGKGLDEGLMIVTNEMERTLASLRS